MVGSTFKTMYLVSKSEVDNNTKKNFKLSLQNKDICDGGMSVSVKPIKRRIRNKPEIENSVQSLNDGNDDDGEDENEADSKSKFKQQYSKPTKQIPPNYGFSRRDSNMEQRRSVNYDKSKLDFSTYSEEFGNDDNGQDKRHYDQQIYNKINPNYKFEPSELKAKYTLIEFGIFPEERAKLHERIESRQEALVGDNLLEEIADILNIFDISAEHPAMKAINYRQGLQVVEGKLRKAQLFEKSLFATRQFAKRQCTWMRGWENLINFDLHQAKEAAEQLKKQLNLLEIV